MLCQRISSLLHKAWTRALRDISISKIIMRIGVIFSRSTTRTHFQFLDLISNQKIKWKRFSFSSRAMRLGENKFSTLSRKKKICIYISNCNLQIKIYISTGSNVSIIHARFAPIDQARDPLSLFASYYIVCHLISNYFHFHTTSAEFCFEYESVG